MTNERFFMVLDTEGTGLKVVDDYNALYNPATLYARGDEVCQIGGMILNRNMIPVKFFCHYCDIVRADSPAGAMSVHGISMKEVRQHIAGQFLPEVINLYLPEILAPNVVFIGYNTTYDLKMIRQTLANAAISFEWQELKTPTIPKTGRICIDLVPYLMGHGRNGTYRRKLSSFEGELAKSRENFLIAYEQRVPLQTNCPELLRDSMDRAHNALFDSINTYLLWEERVWKKKLI